MKQAIVFTIVYVLYALIKKIGNNGVYTHLQAMKKQLLHHWHHHTDPIKLNTIHSITDPIYLGFIHLFSFYLWTNRLTEHANIDLQKWGLETLWTNRNPLTVVCRSGNDILVVYSPLTYSFNQQSLSLYSKGLVPADENGCLSFAKEFYKLQPELHKMVWNMKPHRVFVHGHSAGASAALVFMQQSLERGHDRLLVSTTGSVPTFTQAAWDIISARVANVLEIINTEDNVIRLLKLPNGVRGPKRYVFTDRLKSCKGLLRFADTHQMVVYAYNVLCYTGAISNGM
jgi:hypothetical protein